MGVANVTIVTMSAPIVAAIISGLVSVTVVVLQIISTQHDKTREQAAAVRREETNRLEQQRIKEITDMREELARLRQQITLAEEQLFAWKDKYWTLREQYVTELTVLNRDWNKG